MWHVLDIRVIQWDYYMYCTYVHVSEETPNSKQVEIVKLEVYSEKNS